MRSWVQVLETASCRNAGKAEATTRRERGGGNGVTRAGARRQLGIVDGWEEDGGGWGAGLAGGSWAQGQRIAVAAASYTWRD
jgi:hypothetical protein